nr:zinc ribbon domain-containing protein [Propionibacteriaceae bacterium]
MTSTCPAGHTSASDDYCDVCGMPIDSTAVTSAVIPPAPTDAPTQAPVGQICPNCETPNVAEALFCEACGYDFTTGTMPRSAAPANASAADAAVSTPTIGDVSAAAPFEWVAEVWIDPAWYEAQESP